MTKPKKNPFAAKKSEALINLAMDRAKAALQNENTQKMLVDNGKVIVAQIQQRWSDHKLEGATGGGPGWLSEKFGQGKLERRVEYLAATIDLLSAGRPELTDALAPVSRAVVQLRLAAEIAGHLPIVKRKQAHFRLERKIDHFETMLFEAALPS